MKKIFAILLAMSLLLVACAALAEDDGLAKVLEKGTLVMGFDEEYPPFGFVSESGTHVGFDIDLANEVCARLGVELVLQPVVWESKELELNSGNIDCIWSGMSITPERQEQVLFSMPYLNNDQILVVMTDSGIASAEETAGKVLGTQAGSSSIEALDNNAEFKDALGEVVTDDSFVTMLMDLQLGGIDVLLIDGTVGNYYIGQQDDPSAFTVLPGILSAEEYGIGFRLGEQSLADAVNAQLIAIWEDGTLDAIRANWFANDVTAIAKYADAYKK